MNYLNMKPLLDELKNKLTTDGEYKCLVILQGTHKDSMNYVKGMKKQGIKYNIHFDTFIISDDEPILPQLNKLRTVWKQYNAVIPVMPLSDKVQKWIKYHINMFKDVDNFSGENKFYNHCTAEAIILLLNYFNIGIDNDVLVIGRNTGRHIFDTLIQHDYTCTLAHSLTHCLSKHVMCSDVVISATGERDLITPSCVRPNSFILDVGLGDVHEDVTNIAHVTPCKNGIGALTTLVLLNHIQGRRFI